MKIRDIINNIPAATKISYWICLLAAIGLIIAGFLCPPLAVIDGSILTACGELFAFASLGVGIYAIERGYKTTVRRGENVLTINDDEEK